MDRPFRRSFRQGGDPAITEVMIHFRDVIEGNASLDAVMEGLDALAKFGAVGGFAGPDIEPSISTLGVVGPPVVAHDRLSLQLHTREADAILLTILENLVHGLHLTVMPVDEFAVLSRWPEPRRKSTFYSPLPFVFSDVMEQRRVVISVDFAAPQPPEPRADFIRAWQAWVKLATYGGFADDLHPPDEGGFLVTEEPRSLPQEIVFFHERAEIGSEGFGCFVNALQYLHANVAALDEVALS